MERGNLRRTDNFLRRGGEDAANEPGGRSVRNEGLDGWEILVCRQRLIARPSLRLRRSTDLDRATADPFLAPSQLETSPTVAVWKIDQEIQSVSGNDRTAELESPYRGNAGAAVPATTQSPLDQHEMDDARENRVIGEVAREERARRRDLDTEPASPLRRAGVEQPEGLHPGRFHSALTLAHPPVPRPPSFQG
jgi:hypothetical protein